MIESLDQATVLVLSALAVLFGVPLAMLLWIAAQSIQMRVLRRRLGEVETTLIRLQNQGAATVATTEAAGQPSHATTQALDPTTSAAQLAGVATTLERGAEAEAEPDAPIAAVPEAPRAELQPEPTERELNVPKKRDWLGVSDLPGPVEALLDSGDDASAFAAPGSSAKQEMEAAPPEPKGEGEISPSAPPPDDNLAATDQSQAFEGGAPDSPAREWLRRAAGEAERLAASAEQRRTSGLLSEAGATGEADVTGVTGADTMAAGEIGDAAKDAASDAASEAARALGSEASDEDGPA